MASKGTNGYLSLIAHDAKFFKRVTKVPVTTKGLFVNSFSMDGTVDGPLGTAGFNLPFQRMPACLTNCCGCGTKSRFARKNGPMGKGQSVYSVCTVVCRADRSIPALSKAGTFADPGLVSATQVGGTGRAGR